MMLSKQGLQTAVTRGIITTDQLDQLALLCTEDSTTDTHYSGSEEKFRFFKGFNEIFLSVGLLIFVGGLIGATNTKVFGIGLITMLAAPAIVWLLAEYFVRKKSYVLPGIVLAACFTYFSAFLISILIMIASKLGAIGIAELTGEQVWSGAWNKSPQSVSMCLGAVIGALIFYFRFKVPFTLFIAAGSFVLLVLNSVHFLGFSEKFPDNPVIVLTLGIMVFAVAMAYDLSDPIRKTRAAVCAFWLHLLAAPLIVHAVMSAVGIALKNNEFGTTASLTIIAFIVFLSLVALAIDRRALLVSAFTYFGWAIAHLVRTSGIDNTFVMALTLLLLGAIVLILGTGWQSLRNRLLGPVRHIAPFKYLPPLTLEQT